MSTCLVAQVGDREWRCETHQRDAEDCAAVTPMKVTVTADAAKFCPYMDEEDTGTLEMTFDVTAGDAPELHRLAQQLEAWSSQARSHEEFTRWVAQSTGAVRVVSRWRTAGMDVTCDLSSEPVRA